VGNGLVPRYRAFTTQGRNGPNDDAPHLRHRSHRRPA
jgi:hypothetical protein